MRNLVPLAKLLANAEFPDQLYIGGFIAFRLRAKTALKDGLDGLKPWLNKK
jgi:hypothetical protein